MKRFASIVKLFYLIFLSSLLTLACAKSPEVPKVPAPCLGEDVQRYVIDNDELKRRNIEITVTDVENYNLTLSASGEFSEETLRVLCNGKNLRDIQQSIDPSVGILIELDETIKKRFYVKEIRWLGTNRDRTLGCSSSRGKDTGAPEPDYGDCTRRERD